MRILRLIARLNVGGPARHVVIANRGLRERGHETLLAYGATGAGEESLAQLVSAAALPFVRVRHLHPRLGPVRDARAFTEIWEIIRAFDPDIVHTHTAKAGALGRTAAWLMNLPRRNGRRTALVHTFHGHVLEGYFGTAATHLVRTAERALASVSDRIIVISDQQRHDIVDRFAIAPAAKVRVVPLGLDLDPFLAIPPEPDPDARRRLNVAESRFAVGYVGRLVRIKNLPLLIEAFAEFRRHHPAVLLLAGDGTERSSLEQLVQERGLSDDVRFLGWCSDLVAFYSALDVVVLTSRNEGTPVALIEAMAAGRAVLATDAGGVSDVVRDGVTGVVSGAGDPRAFAGALERLRADAGLRRRLGLAARDDVRRRYASERLVAELERVYQELVP